MLMAHEEQRLHFTGTGEEYFRIWIVNLALTVLTLGVYSAWAKIRRIRYFYRNTQLDGACFDYTAEPGAILLGRAVALLMLAAFTFTFEFSPWLGVLVTVLIGAALPLLMWQAHRFRARNTVYRGIAFGFDGTLAEAYLTYAPPLLVLLAPSAIAAVMFTHAADVVVVGLSLLGLVALPLFHAQFRRYLQRNLRYGDAGFGFEPTVRDFAFTWLKGLGIVVAVSVAVIIPVVILFVLSSRYIAPQGGRTAVIALTLAALVFYYLAFAVIGSYYAARFQKLVWEGTAIDDMAFRCGISARRLLKLQLVNALLIVATLGLYRPFAAVRVAKYRLECMTIIGAEHLGSFQRGNRQSGRGATGDAAGEFFNLDMGL
jgi:uncharacterized membrane protein YjgN (DUF898 family)